MLSGRSCAGRAAGPAPARMPLLTGTGAHDRQYPRHPGDVGGGRGLHLQRRADQARRRDGAVGPGHRRARPLRHAVVRSGAAGDRRVASREEPRPSSGNVARRARGSGFDRLSRGAVPHAVRHRHRHQPFDAPHLHGARRADPEGDCIITDILAGTIAAKLS